MSNVNNNSISILKKMIELYPEVTYDKFVSFFSDELEFADLPFDSGMHGVLITFYAYLVVMEKGIFSRSLFFIKNSLFAFLSFKGPSFAIIITAFSRLTSKLDSDHRIKLAAIIKDNEDDRIGAERLATRNKYLSV